jgi:putative ABC transport system permease protein
VGALLFDMLLLSRGLLVSFRDVLDGVGFDVRVMATDAVTIGGQPLEGATRIAAELRALPEVAEAVPVRVIEPEVTLGRRRRRMTLSGVDLVGRLPWEVTAGRNIAETPVDRPAEMLVNQHLATYAGLHIGDTLVLRPECDEGVFAPSATATIVGVASFPFDTEGGFSGAMLRDRVSRLCSESRDLADMVMVSSRPEAGPDAAVAAIARTRPDVRPATNEQMVARMQDQGFSYFRQISTVLSTITLIFGFLLITVLMTVSVNQRVAEIAAMRALGFSQQRVALDVLWQSGLMVATGGTLAVPLGFALSLWLDRILKAMPGIPAAMHFFVFEPRALAVHASLLVVTAVLAALYPMWLVTSLPIAGTLRKEVAS